jgi:hypothetical protein
VLFRRATPVVKGDKSLGVIHILASSKPSDATFAPWNASFTEQAA